MLQHHALLMRKFDGSNPQAEMDNCETFGWHTAGLLLIFKASRKLSPHFSLFIVYSILRRWVLNRSVAEHSSCIDSELHNTYMKLDSAMTTISKQWNNCRQFMAQISQMQVCIYWHKEFRLYCHSKLFCYVLHCTAVQHRPQPSSKSAFVSVCADLVIYE